MVRVMVRVRVRVTVRVREKQKKNCSTQKSPAQKYERPLWVFTGQKIVRHKHLSGFLSNGEILTSSCQLFTMKSRTSKLQNQKNWYSPDCWMSYEQDRRSVKPQRRYTVWCHYNHSPQKRRRRSFTTSGAASWHQHCRNEKNIQQTGSKPIKWRHRPWTNTGNQKTAIFLHLKMYMVEPD